MNAPSRGLVRGRVWIAYVNALVWIVVALTHGGPIRWIVAVLATVAALMVQLRVADKDLDRMVAQDLDRHEFVSKGGPLCCYKLPRTDDYTFACGRPMWHPVHDAEAQR